MNPATDHLQQHLGEHLRDARRELDALMLAVRESSGHEGLAAAIARRDAVLSTRRDGARVGTQDLVALEAGVSPPVVARSSRATAQGTAAALRYLDALDVGRRSWKTADSTAEQLRPLLARLAPPEVDDRELPPEIGDVLSAVESRVATEREAGPDLVGAATVFRRLSPLGGTMMELPALARLASALMLRPGGALLNDPVLAPQVRTPVPARGYGDTTNVAAEDDEWLAGFARDVAMTARRTRGLVARLSAVANADGIRIDALGKAAASSRRVHGAMQRWPIASIERIMEATGLQVQAATSAVHRLRGLGILSEITRRHRHRLYRYDAWIGIISADVESWQDAVITRHDR